MNILGISDVKVQEIIVDFILRFSWFWQINRKFTSEFSNPQSSDSKPGNEGCVCVSLVYGRGEGSPIWRGFDDASDPSLKVGKLKFSVSKDGRRAEGGTPKAAAVAARPSGRRTRPM